MVGDPAWHGGPGDDDGGARHGVGATIFDRTTLAAGRSHFMRCKPSRASEALPQRQDERLRQGAAGWWEEWGSGGGPSSNVVDGPSLVALEHLVQGDRRQRATEAVSARVEASNADENAGHLRVSVNNTDR